VNLHVIQTHFISDKYSSQHTFFNISNVSVPEKRHLLGCYNMWLLLGTDILKERIASIVRVTTDELGTTLALFTN
jgi:hypothetical protein